MSVYSNVRKILERLVGDPSNGKLHRMRRDVMIRVCGNSETILRTIVEPLFTYCGFLVHDDRFELDSALLVDEAVFLQQQFSMPDSLNGCLISCGRDSKVAPTQDVIEDATDVKEENSTTGGTTTSSTGGTTTSSTGGTTTSSGFIVLASAPKVQKVIRLMKTAELACKGPESLSLMEVMEAVREGVKIPGIIKPTEDEEDTTEDHTNRETPSQLVEIDERPRKPWEK
ncbi:unnamed protein product [Amoebophrya sp. A25]|nr:unnamed protein product [Amoebophrya sp. A25]|eukprot:GSA25T00018375001.1